MSLRSTNTFLKHCSARGPWQRFRSVIGSAALLLSLVAAATTWAATITVTTSIPTVSLDGQCSLIEAMNNANGSPVSVDCPAGSPGAGLPGADTIHLPLASTIALTTVNNTTLGSNGLPLVSSHITIEGHGSTIQRSSASLFRLFAVNSSGSLVLKEVTLTGGRVSGGGGAILNSGGSVVVGNSTIRGNTASIVGGGVQQNLTGGKLTIVGSTVSGNTANFQGGGVGAIGAAGTFTLINSTISGNAGFLGGGVFTGGSTTATITNSTVFGNTAQAQGGGVLNDATATLTLIHTLITGNSGSSGPTIFNNAGTLTADAFNLFGADADAGVVGFTPGVTDIVPIVPVTSILDTVLANNSAPTKTHALVAGSPALNVDPSGTGCEPIDQRGITRPQGGACDVGAFELETLDQDNDGVADTEDNCPADANADQANFDNDGQGDVCDPDDDGDGVNDISDNCPVTPNAAQANLDGDEQGDVCDLDDDGDSVNDTADNCPLNANPDQADLDNDGQGDVCDPDDDGDGANDIGDNCPVNANPDQADLDGDGFGDVCDPDDDGDGVNDTGDNCPFTANSRQEDFDHDGIGDVCDGDLDADTVPNGFDECSFTARPSVVNPSGCSIAQLCPCAGPRNTTKSWKNHGEYVSCVTKSATQFVSMGLITPTQKSAFVSAAAQSTCGK